MDSDNSVRYMAGIRFMGGMERVHFVLGLCAIGDMPSEQTRKVLECDLGLHDFVMRPDAARHAPWTCACGHHAADAHIPYDNDTEAHLPFGDMLFALRVHGEFARDVVGAQWIED